MLIYAECRQLLAAVRRYDLICGLQFYKAYDK